MPSLAGRSPNTPPQAGHAVPAPLGAPVRASVRASVRARALGRTLLAFALVTVTAGAATATAGAVTAPGTTAAALANVPHYSLPLALQESLYFYDAQKSGPARTAGDQPLGWRGDSEPSDSCVPLQPMSNHVGTNISAAFIAANKSVLDPGNTGCVNLSGGFHDAGDHVKFGLPQSYAASVLGWGMYEFRRPTRRQAPGHMAWTR